MGNITEKSEDEVLTTIADNSGDEDEVLTTIADNSEDEDEVLTTGEILAVISIVLLVIGTLCFAIRRPRFPTCKRSRYSDDNVDHTVVPGTNFPSGADGAFTYRLETSQSTASAADNHKATEGSKPSSEPAADNHKATEGSKPSSEPAAPKLARRR